jgi:hypothetical protein
MASSGLSRFAKNAIARSFFRGGDMFIAAFTDFLGADGRGAEVLGGGYARRRSSDWDIVQDGDRVIVSNASDVSYPICSKPWGKIVSVGLFDAPAGGNLIAYGELVTPIGIELANIDQLRLPAKSFRLELR